MTALLRLTVLFGIVFLGSTYALYRVFGWSFLPFSSEGQLKRDVKKLRRYISGFKSELIPLTLEEMKQLSMSFKDAFQYSRLKGIYSGSIETIYHETIAHFTAKLNPSPEDTGVLLVKTKEDEISYVLAGDKCQVYLNGKKYGKIDANLNLWSQLTKQKIAHLSKTKSKHWELFVNNKKLANIFDPKSSDLNNMRAFNLLKDHELHEQRDLVILSFYFFLSGLLR